MPCKEKDRLDAYIDAELSGAEMNELFAHLRGCPECAADALGRMRLKSATREAGKRYQPSAEFRAKLNRQFGGRATSSRRFLQLVPQMAGASALIVIIVLLLFNGIQGSRRQTAELIDEHVTSLASANPVDVVSTDRHTVKPWFQGRLPFAFNLPEVEGTEYALLGGSMVYLDGSPGAHLIYGLRKHKISVFIFQSKPEGSLPVWERPSFTVKTSSQSGLTYTFVSDASGSDVGGLMKMFAGI